MVKLREGINDLVQFKWDRFNSKIDTRRHELETVLLNTSVTVEVVFVHTGTPALAEDVGGVITEYIEEMNDPTETGSFEYFKQGRLVQLLVDEQRPARIDLTVELLDWGQLEATPRAIYGQVKASEAAAWYQTHGDPLLAQNVRVVLPDSEVNISLSSTLSERPEAFWYFNNGVTVLCEKIEKAPAGGADRRVGNFEFAGASVVNGAQTVGTLARAAGAGADLSTARVMVRFISLEGASSAFATEVTRATNTQNRIGGRDFLSLDREQARLRDEFAIDGLIYVFRSGEDEPEPPAGCSVIEATIALACASANTSLSVLAKREVSRLWEDIERTPYKTLFNRNTTYLRIWRVVQVLRIVQAKMEELASTLDGRPRLVAVHGNRFLLHLVFRQLKMDKVDDPSFDWQGQLDLVLPLISVAFPLVSAVVEDGYPGYPASLFKNVKKCGELAEQCLAAIANSAA